MNLFLDIKNGILPEENVIFDILEDKINYNYSNEELEEIKKYINLLSNSFTNASTQEKILLIRVLFVLESILNLEEAKKNFLIRSMSLKLDIETKNYIEIFKKFVTYLDLDFTFLVLQNRLKELYKLSSEELRSFFAWTLHVIWHIQEYHNHNNFTKWYQDFQNLLDELMKQDRISDVMYVEFFTYHIMGNSFQNIDEWREFNKNVTKRTENFYKKYTLNLETSTPTKKNKKRIAFIKDRIVFNSPFQVEYSLFKSLLNQKEFSDNYEIIVYTFNQFEKSKDDTKCIKMLENLGIAVINPVMDFQRDGWYNDHFKKALKLRETLLHDDIDIILAGGVFPILDFIYLSRTAPLQIYYSHGNCAFDIEGIDKRVSHFEQECPEFEWNIINVPMAKEFLVGSEGEKEVGKLIKADYKEKYGEDVVILGTIGRLIKIYNDEYLQTIAKIMKQNPNTIYLACGTGNIETIKEKLKKYNIDEERFLFLGQVNPHIYGWVIDVWPDSFPLRQGQSKNEYTAKGGVVIYMNEYLNDTIRNWYKNFEMKPWGNNEKEYIQEVNKFIKNKELRTKLSKFNKKIFEQKKMDFSKLL